jgi:hypothetical protein
MALRTQWWEFSDDRLLEQCGVDRYRVRGPGGRKRDTTDSAIRLRHQPTGVIVTATENRSQSENRRRALKRLREALALQYRQPVGALDLPPAVVVHACRTGTIQISPRSPGFLSVAAYVLDLLAHHNGRISTVAEQLAVSTASIVAFLRVTTSLWRAAQQIRAASNQRPLR